MILMNTVISKNKQIQMLVKLQTTFYKVQWWHSLVKMNQVEKFSTKFAQKWLVVLITILHILDHHKILNKHMEVASTNQILTATPITVNFRKTKCFLSQMVLIILPLWVMKVLFLVMHKLIIYLILLNFDPSIQNHRINKTPLNKIIISLNIRWQLRQTFIDQIIVLAQALEDSVLTLILLEEMKEA